MTPPFIITIILILLPRPASTAVGQISNWHAYKLCLFAHTAVNHRESEEGAYVACRKYIAVVISSGCLLALSGMAELLVTISRYFR